MTNIPLQPLSLTPKRRCPSSSNSSSSTFINDIDDDESIKLTKRNSTATSPPIASVHLGGSATYKSKLAAHGQATKRTLKAWWTYKPCRYICYGLVALFILLLIFTPLFIKFALPAIISNGFASNGFGISEPIVIRLFQLDWLSNSPGFSSLGFNFNMSDIVGSANITANVSQPGYDAIIPFGIPVTISPMVWTISLAVDATTTTNGFQQTTSTFYPMIIIAIPAESHLTGGILSLNIVDASVQFLNPSAFRELKFTLPAVLGNPQVYPLGAKFIHSFLGCLMSGFAGDGPRVMIESVIDLKVGSLSLNGITLKRVVDIGSILVQNHMPFPMMKSQPKTTQNPDDAFQFSSPLDIITNGHGNVDIAFPKSRYPVNPLTFSFTNLQMRLNVSNVPVYTVTAPAIYEVQGTPNISFAVKTASIGSSMDLMGSFLFQDQSKLWLGVDRVDVRDAIGGKLGWLSDLLGGVWVQIPFSIFGGSSGVEEMLSGSSNRVG
ncbi:UNVERIFIED_CONTAM: hypothetical protein HDU68_010194 [Siphonaria sp. JEL0065]|nr:hypothetical protein HDU68_010194 [Siphonaria sp. JEL0065]